MFRTIGTATFLFSAVACAGHRTSPLTTSSPSTEELNAAYSCVVEAVANEGYPVTTNEAKLTVSSQIRENVGPQDRRLHGVNVDTMSSSSRRGTGEDLAPYSVDGVSARVVVDDRTGRLRVDAEAYTGSAVSARLGYVKRPASARGLAAVTHARTCVEAVQTTGSS